jgi:hypothetical protein
MLSDVPVQDPMCADLEDDEHVTRRSPS